MRKWLSKGKSAKSGLKKVLLSKKSALFSLIKRHNVDFAIETIEWEIFPVLVD